MNSIHYIDAEKVRKVVNKMNNLSFEGLEISDGSKVQIDIRYTDINPYSKAEGYIFADKKQYIAADVLDKCKINFSKTSAEVVNDSVIRMTVYPPRDMSFGIE